MILSVAIIPGAWEIVGRVLRDGYVSAVDIRTLPADRIVSQRSSGGGVLYIGAHKKALLQSLPYLGLLLVPLARMVRPDKNFFALTLSFVTPAAVVLFYAYSFPFHDVGGLCLNTRYFLLALPFTSILCAYAIKDMRDQWGMPLGFPVIVFIALASAAIYFWLTQDARGSIDALEYPMLVVPLWMAIGLAVLITLGLVKSEWSKSIRVMAWVFLIMTTTWAGLVAFSYDYRAHRYARAVHLFYGESIFKFIPTDSILFSDNKSFAASTKVIEKERVRMGFPSEDGFKDFPRLLEFQLRSGRRAFALFHDSLWTQLEREVLSTYQVTPSVILQNFTLSEITFPGVRTDGPSR